MSEQHDRSGFIGGSDAAAIMGLSPWATPLELYLDKTKQRPPRPISREQQRIFDRGHKLEPFIREMAITKLQDMGLEVEHVATNKRYADGDLSFLSCEIDFELIVTGELTIGEKVHFLEHEHINCDAKSVTGFARKKWGEMDSEDVPIEYATQFMHGLGITGKNYCLVAALRSFDDVDVFWTLRDDAVIRAMRAKCQVFWQCVQTMTPPDPITFSDIKLMFPLDNGQAKEATDGIAEKVAQLREIKSRIKTLEEQESLLTFDIGEYISPNALLTYNGAQIATWKAQMQNRLDSKALKEDLPDIAERYTVSNPLRVLRLSKAKT